MLHTKETAPQKRAVGTARYAGLREHNAHPRGHHPPDQCMLVGSADFVARPNPGTQRLVDKCHDCGELKELRTIELGKVLFWLARGTRSRQRDPTKVYWQSDLRRVEHVSIRSYITAVNLIWQTF